MIINGKLRHSKLRNKKTNKVPLEVNIEINEEKKSE